MTNPETTYQSEIDRRRSDSKISYTLGGPIHFSPPQTAVYSSETVSGKVL